MKLQRLILIILLLGLTLPVASEIILQSSADSLVILRQRHSLPMSSIVIISQVPSASASPQVVRNLQHAHGWSVYENQNFETGGALVIGGVGSVKDRQSAVRANVSRAQAFRMDFFK